MWRYGVKYAILKTNQITTSNDSDKDLEPSQFFHYARSAHCMMKEMGYDLHHGENLNFRKGRRIPLQPFVPKEKPANYDDQTRRGLGYFTPSVQSNLKFEKSLPSHSSDSSDWESNISVGVAFKKLFPNITSTSQVEEMRTLSHSTLISATWSSMEEALWATRSPIEDKVI